MAMIVHVLLGIPMITTQVMAEDTAQYHLDGGNLGPGSLKSYECPCECSRRCSKTQYHKPYIHVLLLKMLYQVPVCSSWLLWNKAVCLCYNNWKAKHGGPKCP